MTSKKYALLDTDFISKMHMIRKDDEHTLIDKVMTMPNHIFCCHEQIGIELSRHNIAGAPEWFNDRVADRTIHLYDDEMILDDLLDYYGSLRVVYYIDMLKTACDSYQDRYFEENFTEISKVNGLYLTKDEFLAILESDCYAIGTGKNLGELKSYVLVQALNTKFGKQIYIFCSDDKNARNGIVAIGNTVCVSVLSSFLRLKKEIGFNRDEAEPYIKSYINCCLGKDQTTFKIHDASKERRMIKVPCDQVFEEMFTGKMNEIKNGNLRYIQ